MWRNWAGTVHASGQVATPGSTDELATLLRRAAANNQKLRVAGAGHSFTPLVATDDVIISLDGMQGVIDIDTAARTARVKAGTRLWQIGPALAKAGLAMENLGDITVQSIAGSTSTGTHGTGRAFGNLATQIAAFTLLTASGETLTASPTENPDLFAGGRVALGSLGVITDITLRLVPAFRLKLDRRPMTLDECLQQAPAIIEANRSFEFYWFPHTNSVLTKTWNTTDEPADRIGWGRYLTESVLENTLFGALCATGRALPKLCPAISQFCASLISPGSQIDEGYAILGAERRVIFNEMEWALPAGNGAPALREIQAFIATRAFPLMFPLEYRWVKADDIWLSPDYGRDSVRISAHQYHGMECQTYFDGVQAICRNHGGRPHWGKCHTLKAKDLKNLYPRWDDFQALRERLDPGERFLTPYMRDILDEK